MNRRNTHPVRRVLPTEKQPLFWREFDADITCTTMPRFPSWGYVARAITTVQHAFHGRRALYLSIDVGLVLGGCRLVFLSINISDVDNSRQSNSIKKASGFTE